jgi:hypothetical protein
MVSRQIRCLQQVLCLILFAGIVRGEVFQQSSIARISGKSLPIHYRLVGGAQSSDNNEDDDYDSDTAPPSRDNQRPRRQERRQPPPPPPPKSTFTSLAEKSYALTTHALSATAKQSGKAAYYLIRPKKVEVKELFGLWRMDQSMMLYEDDEEAENSSATIEVTPAGTILLPRNGDGSDEKKSRYTFTPAHLTGSAKLEWRQEDSHQQQYFYKAYIHRKVADPSVIKLKGKSYRVDHTGWRGKTEKLVPVGTFVARRRLKLLPDEEEEDDGGYDDDEDEETMEAEEDWGDESNDGYDVGNDVLAEEEYDDEEEDY